jgi:hypothetical protein
MSTDLDDLTCKLHRASRVPFRGSCFTSGLHPPDATPQGLNACLYRRRGFPPITSLRFVAHYDQLNEDVVGLDLVEVDALLITGDLAANNANPEQWCATKPAPNFIGGGKMLLINFPAVPTRIFLVGVDRCHGSAGRHIDKRGYFDSRLFFWRIVGYTRLVCYRSISPC